MAQAQVGGRYKHYKGKDYTVLAVGKHTETGEEFVVYCQEYDGDNDDPKGTVWIRPKEMWEDDTVNNQGKVVPRFSLIKD